MMKNCQKILILKDQKIDSDDNTYFTVDLLIDINNIIAGSNNITLIKVNVKPCGYDKMYIDKDLPENELHQLVDQFNERKRIIEILFKIA